MNSIEDCERAFRRAGLPLLIEDYSASEDIFTRAFPLLALVFLGETLGALNLQWSPLANLGAVAGGLAILLLSVALANRRRGARALAIPQEVGRLELAGFVLVPALLPIVFGGQITSAVVTAVANLLLVGLFYAGFGFALGSILRWSVARVISQLRAAIDLLARAVPLLLIFSVVLFVNTEMWQVFSLAPPALLGAAIGMVAVLAAGFLGVRVPREVGALERRVEIEGPELDRNQRINVGLVLFTSQAIQVFVVGLAIGLFFIAFGLLMIGLEVRESWLGNAGSVLVALELLGQRVELTSELLRVSAGIAALASLYFAIAVLTDSTYREEFLDEITTELAETFALRAEYLELRAGA